MILMLLTLVLFQSKFYQHSKNFNSLYKTIF